MELLINHMNQGVISSGNVARTQINLGGPDRVYCMHPCVFSMLSIGLSFSFVYIPLVKIYCVVSADPHFKYLSSFRTEQGLTELRHNGRCSFHLFLSFKTWNSIASQSLYVFP